MEAGVETLERGVVNAKTLERGNSEFKLNNQEKSIIYDILVSSGIWESFFFEKPSNSRRHENISALFKDPCSDDGKFKDERTNVLFLYDYADRELHPHIKNMFSSNESRAASRPANV